ncbi:MAG: hypothetical protein HQL67_02365 [Magnetococcales bacterium]|nr:hypothetical protein [Magnetococcales bacterium]
MPLLLTPGLVLAESGRWSGYVGVESRLFPEQAADNQQRSGGLSLAIQPEYYKQWDKGDQFLAFVPFLRLDAMDPERTHADIRELTWVMVGSDWEIRTGIRKLFWGVTESQHLVDVINQTDGIESIDGEKKLGQPMINLSLIRDYGTFDLFLLPYFRERTFAGNHGRLRTIPRVEDDLASYESSAKEHHLDWAARWYHSLGDWDLGLSHFYGTSRSPTYNLGVDGSGQTVLTPYYALMEQTGIDIQSTKDAWLWKLEAISQRSQADRHTALTGGFEYTFVGVMDSDADLGLISEYLFDDRGEQAPTPLESDLMVGVRLVLNDVDSTDLLVGGIVDLNQQNVMVTMEGSRRVMDNWKLSIEGRLFAAPPIADPLYSMRRDSFVKLELIRYF